jgi:hypothetical protein
VCRENAARSSGCKSHPAAAPAGTQASFRRVDAESKIAFSKKDESFQKSQGILGRRLIMRSSSSFVAPSAIAILSIALLCSQSGTAMSQTETGPAVPLPSITVVAPKQVARPRQVATPPQRPARAATVASRRTAPTPQTPGSILAKPGPVLAKIAELEKLASSCNGGCETSFRSGNAPWVGCSEAAGTWSTFSATCKDTLTYKTYLECKDTKVFLGLDQRKAWWFCSSMQAGGKFAGEQKVAERSGRR